MDQSSQLGLLDVIGPQNVSEEGHELPAAVRSHAMGGTEPDGGEKTIISAQSLKAASGAEAWRLNAGITAHRTR